MKRDFSSVPVNKGEYKILSKEDLPSNFKNWTNFCVTVVAQFEEMQPSNTGWFYYRDCNSTTYIIDINLVKSFAYDELVKIVFPQGL